MFVSHQPYDCLFVRFRRERQAVKTVKQIADIVAYNPCRSTQKVRQQYDARTIISRSHVRLSQDGRANLQDCRKTKEDVV